MRAQVLPLVLLGAMATAFCQVPPGAPTDGAGHYITWDAFTSSGTDFLASVWRGDSVVARVAHSIDGGSTTPSFGTSATETLAVVRHGYRFIDFDVRKPYSYIDSLDTISYAPQWLVSWGGMDTTYEDGEGWGLRGFTVEYAVGSPESTWFTWFSNVNFTEAMFGPSSPVVVQDSTKYYFRVRAEDLNTNAEDEHYYDQWVLYIAPSLRFSVQNLEGGKDWTVRDTLAIGEDSLASPTAQDVFIVKNLSILDSIDMALRSYSVALPMRLGWELADYPDTNKFALRAIFNDDPTPPSPSDFAATTNIVRDTFIVANDSIFGPGGYHIKPVWADSLSRTDNLWLQFQLPTWSYTYGETTDVQLILQLKAIPVTP